MARRILSRITPSSVIATIALFAALGGGYAVAFSGSGSLQKAALDGISQSFQTARTLNGFGTLEARCDLTDDEIEYRLHNTSGHQIQVRAFFYDGGLTEGDQGGTGGSDGHVHRGGVAVASTSAPPGADSAVIEPADVTDGNTGAHDFRMHLFTFSSGEKRQVELTGTDFGPFDNDCTAAGDTRVRILALNTQE